MSRGVRIVAIDAGGTWIKAARMSLRLEVEFEQRVPSGATHGVQKYFASIAAAIEACRTSNDDVVALSLPGVLDRERRRLLYSPNVKGLRQTIDVGDSLGEHLTGPVWVAENDANCAALGEWQKGRGQGQRNQSLLHFTWGTGIGTGFVFEGKPQYGWEGGHMPVCFERRAGQFVCGIDKSLEAVIGVPYLVERARSLWQQQAYKTALTKADFADKRQTPIRLSQLAQEDDSLATFVLREAMQYMARGLISLSLICYPDIVTIGGAMMDSDWLLDELRSEVEKQAVGIAKTAVAPEQVWRAQLGNEAGLVGAAVLARQTIKARE